MKNADTQLHVLRSLLELSQSVIYKQQILQRLILHQKYSFLEESEYGRPEIMFGDGIVGRDLVKWRCS